MEIINVFDEIYLLHFEENSRKFYLNDELQRTWMKTSAKQFKSIEEAQIFKEKIRDNQLDVSNLTYRLMNVHYTIIPFNEARNY